VHRHSQHYIRNALLAAGAHIILVLVSVTLLKQTSATALRYLIAILPMLPLIFAFRSFLHQLANMDELQQRIQLQAIGFAAGATGMITLAYAYLENAGLPQLSMIWVFPLICLFWSGASWALARRYQ
jgi:hypothetical protein